jgi:hypothetical protein
MPYWAIQATIYSIALLIASIAFYFFIKYLCEYYNLGNPRLSAFLGALFFIFNPYTIFIFNAYIQAYFRSSVIALALLFYTKGLLSKSYLKYSVYFSLSVSLLSVNFGNIAHLIPIIITLFLFLIFFIASERFKVKVIIDTLKFNAILIGIFILFNLWWLVSLSFVLKDLYASGYSNVLVNNIEALKILSPNIFNVITLGNDISAKSLMFYASLFLPICSIVAVIFLRRSGLYGSCF